MYKIVSNNSAMTKIVLVVVLVIFLAVVYSRANADNVSMSKIENDLKAKTNIETMQKCNDRQLKQFIGLDYLNYDSYIYYKSKESLGVDEILIVKAKHRSDLDAVQDAVEERISQQTSTFESYGPTQVSLLKNAFVIKKGRYLFYCVSKTPEKYEEVFQHAI
ncbi:DUF4358 domain-containing protein [Aminicella lysinilytica]|uniref:Uncharacterized protein DUF4358 n=1 Tax=Aminicella lysinilytica TaxID=433323 RepID=A0A4R6PXJ3_9FIRM|nr:DUF4358 domain-containing protein [Aminicella lysinilytica]NLD11725.1 DUF4358 domain-containing protein [Clostridiales bacterium]TDP51069.1 uncharacterized protein DUF4358 [Aminicella lysinilytica]